MTWHPTQSANGHNPELIVTAEDRLFVSYGFAECWIAELVVSPSGAVTSLWERRMPGRGWAAMPFGSSQMMYWEHVGEPSSFNRRLIDLRGPEPQVQIVEGRRENGSAVGRDQSDIGGNSCVCSESGYFAEWRALDKRLSVNGVPVAHGVGGVLSIAGDFVTHGADLEHTHIARIEVSSGEMETAPALVGLHQSSIAPDGRVAYGGYGPIRGIWNPSAPEDLSLRLRPWLDEGSPRLFEHESKVWLATQGYIGDSFAAVMLRPWGEEEVLQVEMPASYISVATHKSYFVIAAADAQGRLKVTTIPVSMQRSKLPESVPRAAVPQLQRLNRFIWTLTEASRETEDGKQDGVRRAGNAVWSTYSKDDQRLVHEGADPAWASRVRNGKWLSVDFDVRGTKEQFEQACAKAKEQNVPLVLYKDGPLYSDLTFWSTEKLSELCKKAGVAYVHGLQAYLHALEGYRLGPAQLRIETEVTALRGKPTVLIVRGDDSEHNARKQDVEALMLWCFEQCRRAEWSHVLGLYCFGSNRQDALNDSWWSGVEAAWNAVCAAVPQGTRPAGWPEAPKEEPETEEPRVEEEPSVVAPKAKTGRTSTATRTGLGVAIVAFLAALFSRKKDK